MPTDAHGPPGNLPPTVRVRTTGRAPWHNDADARFLAGAQGALDGAARISDEAALMGAGVEVRRLARSTLAVEVRLLRAAEGLDGAPPGSIQARAVHARSGAAAAGLRDADRLGPDLDASVADLLVVHIQSSLRRARAEMVDGHDGRVRGAAQDSIRGLSRELSSIVDHVADAHRASRQAGAPGVHRRSAALGTWEGEGGSTGQAG